MDINKKDIFLLIAGVTVGHLLSTYLRKNRIDAQATKDSKESSVEQA
jgi:hypothetical protein